MKCTYTEFEKNRKMLPDQDLVLVAFELSDRSIRAVFDDFLDAKFMMENLLVDRWVKKGKSISTNFLETV